MSLCWAQETSIMEIKQGLWLRKGDEEKLLGDFQLKMLKICHISMYFINPWVW